ncbi:MAG: efflux RND transporter periplasmic adaptor subunit [bacterium]|nr:efflux RND transporter periplasmic adaptor subunit [bacterium]
MQRSNQFNSSIQILFSIFLILSLLNSSQSGLCEDDESESAPLEEMQAHVSVMPLHEGEMTVSFKTMGFFAPRQQSPVSVIARYPGIIQSVNVQEGESVDSGQTIIQLDGRIATSNAARAQASLQQAEAELKSAQEGGLDMTQTELDLAAKQAAVAAEQARLESQREQELLADQLTSAKAARDAELAMQEAERQAKALAEKAKLFRTSGRDAELKRLRSALDQAKADVQMAQLELESTTIVAPAPGRVSGLNAMVGASIDDKTPLAQVIGGKTTVFRMWMSPSIADRLEPGLAAAIDIPPSTAPLQAKIISIGGELDPETGLVAVEAQPDSPLENRPRIGEIFYASVTSGDQAKGYAIHDSAIVLEDDKASVYYVDEEHVAHAAPVTVLARDGDVAIIEGEALKEGLEIIIDGNYNLPDGAHVVEEAAE